jgi:hypothetical protein
MLPTFIQDSTPSVNKASALFPALSRFDLGCRRFLDKRKEK